MVLSYRHAFHAGNLADVVKHITLGMLMRRVRGLSGQGHVFFDTHAGSGRYDLRSEYAQKRREYEQGLQRVWAHRGSDSVPEPVRRYLDAVVALNAASGASPADAGGEFNAVRYVPGSPWLARHWWPLSRLILGELHPTEFTLLRQQFLGQPNTSLHHLDAKETLCRYANLGMQPGLLLMDPSYERPEHYAEAAHAIVRAAAQWPGATIALWLPLLHRKGALVEQALDVFRGEAAGAAGSSSSSRPKRVLYTQLAVASEVLAAAGAAPVHKFAAQRNASGRPVSFGGGRPPVATATSRGPLRPPLPEGRPLVPGPTGLRGTAMVIVNPPQGLAEELSESVLPWLVRVLAPAGPRGKQQQGASFETSWLR